MPKSKRKPKPSVSNEQQLEGPGGQGGESRGGFDPMMGWSAAAGVGLAGIVYAKTKTPVTNIPVQKVRGKETWTAEEQSNYYAALAAGMEKDWLADHLRPRCLRACRGVFPLLLREAGQLEFDDIP